MPDRPSRPGGDTLGRTAREYTREQFCERWPHPFLAIGDLRDDLQLIDETRTLELPRRTGPVGGLEGLEALGPVGRAEILAATREVAGIFPVVKSDRNPYQDRISIGRTRTCDIVIPTRFVSKLHAHLIPVPGGWELRDANSMNGTYKNEKRLRSDERTPIASGDVIRFGHIDAHFFEPGTLYDLIRRRSSKLF